MKLWYHGTSIENALKIAENGALLSPLDQTISVYNKILQTNPMACKSWEGKNPPQTLEEHALELMKLVYSAHEIEHRVKSVSLSHLNLALTYANRFEDRHGGIILGFALRTQGERRPHVLYVSRRLALDQQLTELYFTPKAEQHRMRIEEAFRKYAPVISHIPE